MLSNFLLIPYLYSSSFYWRVETLARQNQDLIVYRSISDELSASSTHEFAIVSISSQIFVCVTSSPHPTAMWPKLSISQPCQLLSFIGYTVNDFVWSYSGSISAPHCNVERSSHLQRQFSAALDSASNSTSSHLSITSEASSRVSSLLNHLYFFLLCFVYSCISAYRRVM